jgi:hypothetical protein
MSLLALLAVLITVIMVVITVKDEISHRKWVNKWRDRRYDI